jgi:hypothetical protein
MISMVVSRTVDRWFEPRSSQTKENKIRKICLPQNNVFDWRNISMRGLLFQWANTVMIQLQRAGLVQSVHHLYLIECNLLLPWLGWKIAQLALNNNQSLRLVYQTLPFISCTLQNLKIKVFIAMYKKNVVIFLVIIKSQTL